MVDSFLYFLIWAQHAPKKTKSRHLCLRLLHKIIAHKLVIIKKIA